ncbi:hypothetical protein K5M36_06935 [Chromobacterium vaccinii]|uniref:hypothetical protein n=1 Tax=Chromobacterium vaccinii TaxID=1108595 RepID=UPI000617B7AE|nr:hypothetical protein [Chromobacterium vaccinii]MBX9346821.1 hypothetical protein [Chromobacterium vaccinii]QND85656.1 Uncharacterized protein ChrSW_3430 [Chromobacterium vaccinii]QND90887.1 Uncharacterized protein ChrSV_3430 [Chromobacterium vaccinii]SUX55991.1 Uncharacterised protein [Chromobacterium vaccinii]
MIKLFQRMRDNRRLAVATLLLSTLIFMLASAFWRGGAAEGALAALLCPLLLLLALAGQLSSLLALLQKPRK